MFSGWYHLVSPFFGNTIINLIGFELMCTMSNDINNVLYMYIYALQLENTSESDPHSYEATKTVAKKA